MFFIDLLGALLIALILVGIFSLGFRQRGPWGSFWTFFLILFLLVWAISLWTAPVGPIFWHIAWLDLLFIGLVFAFLLTAVSSTAKRDSKSEETENTEAVEMAVAVGVFFWLTALLLIIAIASSYWWL